MPAAHRNLTEVMLHERPDLEQVKSVLASVAGALHHVHEQGLVHANLNPTSIVRLTDGVTWSLVDLTAAVRVGEVVVPGKMASSLSPPVRPLHPPTRM